MPVVMADVAGRLVGKRSRRAFCFPREKWRVRSGRGDQCATSPIEYPGSLTIVNVPEGRSHKENLSLREACESIAPLRREGGIVELLQSGQSLGQCLHSPAVGARVSEKKRALKKGAILREDAQRILRRVKLPQLVVIFTGTAPRALGGAAKLGPPAIRTAGNI